MSDHCKPARLEEARLVEDHRRRMTGSDIEEAYRLLPQTDEETAEPTEDTRTLVAEEPW